MVTEYRNNSATAYFLILLALLFLFLLIPFAQFANAVNMLAFEIEKNITHGERVHGEDYQVAISTIENCPDPNQLTYWFNPMSRYQIRSCPTDDGGFALQIFKWVDGKYEEVTAFVYRNHREIIEYLIDSGYIKVIWMLLGGK